MCCHSVGYCELHLSRLHYDSSCRNGYTVSTSFGTYYCDPFLFPFCRFLVRSLLLCTLIIFKIISSKCRIPYNSQIQNICCVILWAKFHPFWFRWDRCELGESAVCWHRTLDWSVAPTCCTPVINRISNYTFYIYTEVNPNSLQWLEIISPGEKGNLTWRQIHSGYSM